MCYFVGKCCKTKAGNVAEYSLGKVGGRKGRFTQIQGINAVEVVDAVTISEHLKPVKFRELAATGEKKADLSESVFRFHPS